MSRNGVGSVGANGVGVGASPNADALFERKVLLNGLDKWRTLSKFTGRLKDPNKLFEPSGMP